MRLSSRRPAGFLFAALVVTTSLGFASCAGNTGPVLETPASATAFPGVALVPKDGVALGIYYGDGDAASTDAAIGATPLINLTYFGWKDRWATDHTLAMDRERGQISLVNWEPFDVDFHDIVAGRYDDMLMQRATEAASLPGPVFVDFAAEMNEEEGWGGHDPELYKAAYRHLHDIFDPRDGGNVVWVWAPNNVDSADAPTAMEYYPGDEYVDWTGIDGYNWGASDPDFEWQSFESVFRDVYNDLHAVGKPIIIGETASAEEGGDKAAWIADIVPTLQQEFPDVRGLVWFDVDKERDWRIRSSESASEAFRALTADPYVKVE